MTLRFLALAAVTVAALPVAGLPAQETVTSSHAEVTYTSFSGIANTAAQTVDDVWEPMIDFFTPLGLTDLSPIEIVITDSVDDGAPAKTLAEPPHAIWLSPSNPVTIGGTPNYRTSVVHEMFHALSFRAGIVGEEDVDTLRDRWLIEGAAEMAEHLFLPQEPHKQSRFQNYLYRGDIHGDSLLDADHYSSLFVYYLWKEGGRDNLPFDLMDYFGTWRDGEQIAQTMDLGRYWKEFTKKMWNRAPVSPILIDGAPVSQSSGGLLQPDFTEPGVRHTVPATGSVPVPIELPPLSWKHLVFEVPSGNEQATFYMGGLAESESFVAHAFIEDPSSGDWRYEDWSGEPMVRLCMRRTGICASETPVSVARVALILANADLETSLDDTLAAGAMADRWRLTEVQVAADNIVPVTGELTLEFGTNGGLLTRSHGFWLVFPESDFAGQSRLAYRWINRACRMKGFVRFRRDNERAEYDDAEERDRFAWDTERLEVGGLIDTPSGWWCDFTPELAVAIGAGGGITATVAAVFTRLNTREYPAGSFAARLSNVMKAVLSLQVPASGTKELVMCQRDDDGRTILQVELQGNVRAFFEPAPSEGEGDGPVAHSALSAAAESSRVSLRAGR